MCSSGQGEGKFEIGRILHLKFETRNLRLDSRADCPVQFEISSFEFEMQDSSNFKFSLSLPGSGGQDIDSGVLLDIMSLPLLEKSS
jgi:hypothetical protein